LRNIKNWHLRTTEPLTHPSPPIYFVTRIAGRLERKVRARSKQKKDASRLSLWRERKRLFQEAFHDKIISLGEVDARSESKKLETTVRVVKEEIRIWVEPGDVLQDPKLRYTHPCLRKLYLS